MYEDRIQRAVDNFKQGYNCAQAVTAAFADLYSLTEEQALLVSASFGGGIGRMREVCGAASGMFILAGMQTGTTDPKDSKGKEYNYQVVQQLASEFRKRNGSIICGELLGLRKPAENSAQQFTDTKPEERTPEYYKKRPCVKMVEEAARIFAEYLCTINQ
ncbi:MAG: C_GCAxxG_C_C family protein [Bacteroidaceae bacterium]|nr:C_GCAxxG_C_C family protein [Bacteroidaceae bacterium]